MWESSGRVPVGFPSGFGDTEAINPREKQEQIDQKNPEQIQELETDKNQNVLETETKVSGWFLVMIYRFGLLPHSF